MIKRWRAQIREGKRGKGRRRPEQCGHGGIAIAGGEVVTGAHGTRPTGHGSKNRGHREKEGEQGTSARLIQRPEDAAEAAVGKSRRFSDAVVAAFSCAGEREMERGGSRGCVKRVSVPF